MRAVPWADVLSTLVPILSTVLLCASETLMCTLRPWAPWAARHGEADSGVPGPRLPARMADDDCRISTEPPEMLDGYFVGRPKSSLSNTIQQEQRLGIQTLYRDPVA